MSTNVGRVRQALWLGTPFFTGAVIMSLELVGFRLYAPYFGYSIFVWGSMISVMMAALAAGYAFGGWVADRSESDFPLYLAILVGALYQLGGLFTAHTLLRRLAQSGVFGGSALASLTLFAVPMAAMATACPFLVRLLSGAGRIGEFAGKVYALSTIGGIAGLLGTAFLLVPHFGTQAALKTICILSLAIAAAGLVPHARIAAVASCLIGALPLVPQPTLPPATVWVADSPYSLVRVERDGEWTILKLNQEDGVHTMRNAHTPWTGRYYDDFALGPLLAPAKQLLVLGLGGGGSIATTKIVAPNVDIDAVEIDPRVVEAAARFFGTTANSKLRIHIADARPWLMEAKGIYDIVHVDLYQGGPHIPFYLVTVEFFESVRLHMSEDGLLMMNVFDVSRKRELLASTVATLERVFPSVVVLPSGYGNRMLVAFARTTSIASIRASLAAFEGDSSLERLARRAEAKLADFPVPAGTPVFVDDLAPVEEMTERMLHESKPRFVD